MACWEQSCHRRTRGASPLPRLHCAQTVQALPPCITGHLFCRLGDRPKNSYAVYQGGAVQSWLCLCPHPSGTMNCDSTRHIQKTRHPTLDHARLGTAVSSTPTLNGDVPICTPLGLHPCVYVMSLKAYHGESWVLGQLVISNPAIWKLAERISRTNRQIQKPNKSAEQIAKVV